MEPAEIPNKFIKILQTTGNLPFPRSGHTAIQKNNLMYIFGGFSGTKCFNELFTLNCDSYVFYKPFLQIWKRNGN